MNAITAIWTNGQIVPSEPVDWPEGTRLVVRLIESSGEKVGLAEIEAVRKQMKEGEKDDAG
jgi:predicted DNA-binding antitoxin AbrB/MazE fold protein